MVWMPLFEFYCDVMAVNMGFMIDRPKPMTAVFSGRLLTAFPAHPFSTELFEAFHQPIMSQAGSE